MDGGDIASTIIGALGLLGGIIGFLVAQRARRDAESAQVGAQVAGERAAKAAEDAARALKESAAAAVDSADALRRANEIAEAQLPSKKPRWSVRHVRGSIYEAVNVSPGEGLAKAALLRGAGEDPGMIRPEINEPRDVPAGRALGFHLLRYGGGTPTLEISYEEGGERVTGTIEIR